MLVWIENTSLALWVGTSLWAYPVLLSAHITGLAVIVGIIAMRDFHLLGFINGVTEANFLELKKLAYCGFLINGISELCCLHLRHLICQQIYLSGKTFFIGSGMLLASKIYKKIEKNTGRTSTKILAILSLFSWFGAITAWALNCIHILVRKMIETLTNEIMASQLSQWIQATYWLWPVLEIIHFLV